MLDDEEAADQPSAAAPPMRSGVLHGRLMGRRLRPGQATLLSELLPRYALSAGAPLVPDLLFDPPRTALRVEVGFGAGEHLAAAARAHPEIGFIGCEPFRNGVVGLLQTLAVEPLPNIRIHVGDAGEVLDRLPAGSVGRLDLLYPDPWPKRRQRKRRFVSAPNLVRLARVIRPGGTFRFATDIDDYAGWTLRHLMACPAFCWEASCAADWQRPWPDWTRTRYEAKALRAGRRPVYLTFTRL